MKKVWITGADGHVGTALLNLLDCTEYQILTTDIDAVDITDIDEVTQYVRVNRPDVVQGLRHLTGNGGNGAAVFKLSGHHSLLHEPGEDGEDRKNQQ